MDRATLPMKVSGLPALRNAPRDRRKVQAVAETRDLRLP